ncbi:Vacuolar protein sorting-associated protein 54 [Drechmeria coniospora]|uniref:Vacuolar protein sorting-associated protein 54 n=1 Tax=Drechmeria coniospora TaxID=98403 RepID=A0A151GWS2_DRECN|nr:Vacuolar protein sorting-associated protein 54 [Drechmeria coniospora]KYK61548.1 Vacuolar protein sorting-associated protein 54 [Drechmeria coniospora]
MFSSPAAGKSVDSLTPLSPATRHEFPMHSRRSSHLHPGTSSRRSSIANSMHSVGGVLDSSTSTWGASVFESGQNAISTLLQPPIVRTGFQPHSSLPVPSSHKPPTAKDIPPVTLTNIPVVDVEEFAPYLTHVGPVYEQLRRLQEDDDEIPSTRRGSRVDRHAEAVADGLLRPSSNLQGDRRGSVASLASLDSVEMPNPLRRSSTGFLRKGSLGPPPLSTIPTVYFDEGFHLENPRTFDVVSEWSEVVRPPNAGQPKNGDASGTDLVPRKALATNAILQEKLSWYMDTIEVHLINSISTASTTFFSALGSLKELHSETSESVQRIQVLRKELEALDEEIVSSGLQIVQKRRRRENLRQLNDAVLQLRQIVDGFATCESLVDAGEVDEALVKIDSLEKLIAGERDQSEEDSGRQLRDMRSASALQGVNNDLSTLRFRIGKAYESQFANFLMADLRRHVESVTPADVLLRWSNATSRSRGSHTRSSSVFPTYLNGTQELKTQLLQSMIGLHRAKHVATAAMTYREIVLREVKNLIRRPLPSSNDDDNESMMSVSTAGGGRQRSNQEKSANLARNLRALDPEDAEELLIKIYIGVTETLRRLTTQVKVLLDIASSLTDSPLGDGIKSPQFRSPITSPQPDRHGGISVNDVFGFQEELHKTLDEATLLTQAVDVANDKIVKVLRVRGEQATHLPLDFFLRYFTLNLYFANECEAISGRSGTSLKTVVNGHIKDFVQRNRDMEMQKLAVGMESDQWVAKDFTEKNGKLLDLVLKSSTEDGSDWMDSSKIWVPYREFERDLAEPTMDDTNGASKDKVRSAVIEFESFMLPNSAILCLEGMNNFMHLIAGIPSMTTDVAASLIAYLQLFNSRCTQLILGAGATRSAGLKNINAKHLALASQALAFIAAIIPHTREFVRRHAPTGAAASSLMGEFDKVRRLLQEHQDSIHQKLVDIMGGRAAIHAKSIKATDWDAKEVNGPLKFMEVLAKETTTLHRALTKHLPEALIPMIMEPVFSSYKEQIGAAFSEGNPRTEAGHKSMLRNVEFFSSKLGNLHGFGDAGEYLMSIVKAKEIKLEAPAEAVEESSQVSAEVKQVPTEDAKEVAEEKAQDSQDSTAAVEVAPDAKVEPSDS